MCDQETKHKQEVINMSIGEIAEKEGLKLKMNRNGNGCWEGKCAEESEWEGED